MYIMTRGRLALSIHTAEQIDRTGYRYAVTCAATALTAFRTREALVAWLDMVGVCLTAPLPAEGEHGWQMLHGSYREAMTYDGEALRALDGFRFREMSNGRYTLGVAVADADGITTLWCMNPNAARPTFGTRESDAAIDAGDYAAPAVADNDWKAYDPLMTNHA